MEDRNPAARLHRHMAGMVALEHTIEQQLDALLEGGLDRTVPSAEFEALLSGLRRSTRSQRQALAARLQAVAADVRVPQLVPPVSPLHRHDAPEYPGSAALFALHAAYSQAVVGYAVLMELAFRAADSVELLGPDNSGDLARQHMRAYVALVRDIIRALPRVVVDELEHEGLDCHCICPSCALGVCLCPLAFGRQLAVAWADAGPIDALAGIEMVRPRSGSAALGAGLQKGDVLLAVDAAEIESIPMLQEAIRSHASGEEITFDVRRETGERGQMRVVRP